MKKDKLASDPTLVKMPGKMIYEGKLCDVWRLDDDVTYNEENLAPYSHGFVNLYYGNKYIAFCGSSYYERNCIEEDTEL